MNFKTIATGMDVRPLLERLAIAPELWQAGKRETYPGSAHAQAQSILIRWVRRDHQANTLQAVIASLESVDYPAADVLMPTIGRTVMAAIERIDPTGDIGHVMLTKLEPGARIARHMDEGQYADYYDRFHLCLQGDESNNFECGGEWHRPVPGDLFWFNHKREHQVVNAGEIDRIHLIIDVTARAYTALRGTYYQEERVSEIWAELTPLLERHWREIAHYQDILLNPDTEVYERAEAAGQLRCYTVRDAGELVGYVVFFVRTNIHYSGSLQAHQDVLFIAPEKRNGTAGPRLIRFAEGRLKAQGVQVVYHHAKLTNRMGPLLARMGYEVVDHIYAKRLDKKGT